MQYLNRNIIIRNIKTLMLNNHITQVELAQILEMSQPNLSKALNENGTKYFTLEQIYGIAQHFNVSTDFLLGLQETSKISTSITRRDIAAFIAKCIQKEYLKVTTNSETEEVFIPHSDPFYGYSPKILDVEYPFLHFPDHWSPRDRAYDDEEFSMYQQEAYQIGNDTGNIPINNFLRNFLQIHSAYNLGNISKSVYETVVEDLLNHVPNN